MMMEDVVAGHDGDDRDHVADSDDGNARDDEDDKFD